MGKKKRFIDKKTAEHFHVVHRSQRDPQIDDPSASKFVLVSSKESGFRVDGSGSRKHLTKAGYAGFAGNAISCVNEEGFDVDGYDYSQHMREMGECALFCLAPDLTWL